MSEQNKIMLSSFMKKQISEKSSKKDVARKVAASAKNAKTSAQAKGDTIKDEGEKDLELMEDLTDEELVAEAKKESRGKAADFDQSEMIKKMILEAIVKYTVLGFSVIIFSLAMIKFLPAILSFLNGIFYKAIIAAITNK